MEKKTRLTLAICLSFTFMLCEVGGGIWANSLAILADAAHLLTDIAGFAIALLATVMATSPASKNYTFGLARAEVMGALASILTLWVMTGCLIVEAYSRSVEFFKGTAVPVDGRIMFVVACMGVVVNLCLACVFLVNFSVFLFFICRNVMLSVCLCSIFPGRPRGCVPLT